MKLKPPFLGATAILTWIVVGVLVLTETEATVMDIWLNMMVSMVIGGYFGAASFIFENEKWSPLKQIVIHFASSVIVFLPLAIVAGWVYAEPLPLLIGLGIFIVTYTIFWFVIRAILIMQVTSMNSSVKKK